MSFEIRKDIFSEERKDDLKIVGKGLEADLKTEVIKLINHTRTIYYDQ